jgi:hypothetical protein
MKDLNHRKAGRRMQNIIFRILLCIIVLVVAIFGMTELASLKKPPAEAKKEERALRVEAVRVWRGACPESGGHLSGGIRDGCSDSSSLGCGRNHSQGRDLVPHRHPQL